MLRLTGTVHHTPHDGHLELLHAGPFTAPHRHLLLKVILNLLSHMLEEGAGRSSATRAAGNLGTETPEAQGLQDLLCDSHLFGAVASRRGCE
jgi:hypothetical protein